MSRIQITLRLRPSLLSILIAVMLLGIAGPAHSQGASGASPRIELAGAYSFLRANPANSGGLNLNGASESLAYAFSGRFSAAADVGEYRFSGLSAGLTSTMYTYLFGPRIAFRRRSHVNYFVQILAGGGRLNANSGGISAGENGFAMAAGGGLDVAFGGRFAVRVVQADYLVTRYDSVAGSPATQSHTRISAGVVFRFGGRE